MKKAALQPMLPYAIAALAVALAAYFFYETRRQNAQLAELIAQTGRAGDKTKPQDPYLAGPVKNRILKGYPEIHTCYKSYLETKPAKDSGKLRVDWQITTSGRALKPEVVVSDFGDAAFEKCITEKIAAWTFPEPAVQKYVEHTFRFENKDKK